MSKCIKAIPPMDYSGTMSDWITALNSRGYDGDNYTCIKIPEDVWWAVLNECEPESVEW